MWTRAKILVLALTTVVAVGATTAGVVFLTNNEPTSQAASADPSDFLLWELHTVTNSGGSHITNTPMPPSVSNYREDITMTAGKHNFITFSVNPDLSFAAGYGYRVYIDTSGPPGAGLRISSSSLSGLGLSNTPRVLPGYTYASGTLTNSGDYAYIDFEIPADALDGAKATITFSYIIRGVVGRNSAYDTPITGGIPGTEIDLYSKTMTFNITLDNPNKDWCNVYKGDGTLLGTNDTAPGAINYPYSYGAASSGLVEILRIRPTSTTLIANSAGYTMDGYAMDNKWIVVANDPYPKTTMSRPPITVDGRVRTNSGTTIEGETYSAPHETNNQPGTDYRLVMQDYDWDEWTEYDIVFYADRAAWASDPAGMTNILNDYFTSLDIRLGNNNVHSPVVGSYTLPTINIGDMPTPSAPMVTGTAGSTTITVSTGGRMITPAPTGYTRYYAVSTSTTAPTTGWQESNIFENKTYHTPYYGFIQYRPTAGGTARTTSVASSAYTPTKAEQDAPNSGALGAVDIAYNSTIDAPVSGGSAIGDLIYVSSRPLVATVDPDDGTIRAVASSGEAIIRAYYAETTNYYASDYYTVATVTAIKADQAAPDTGALSPLAITLRKGATQTVTASGGGNVGTLTYTTTNGNVASVSSAGVIEATGVSGTATITAYWAGNSYYNASEPYTLAVVTADYKYVAIPSDGASRTYTGDEMNHNIETNTTAYTISGQTTGTNVGTYTVTLALTADYEWSDGSRTNKTLSWAITTAGTASISGGEFRDLTYNGSAQDFVTTAPTVTGGGTISYGLSTAYTTEPTTWNTAETTNAQPNTTSEKTYYVWAKAAASDNYDAVGATRIGSIVISLGTISGALAISDTIATVGVAYSGTLSGLTASVGAANTVSYSLTAKNGFSGSGAEVSGTPTTYGSNELSVVASANYYNSATKTVTVTVAKGTGSVSGGTYTGFAYTGGAQDFVTTAPTRTGDGTIEYALHSNDTTAPTEGWSSFQTTSLTPNTYYVWVRVLEGTNYNAVSAQNLGSITITNGIITGTLTLDDTTATVGVAHSGTLSWEGTSGVSYAMTKTNELSLSSSTISGTPTLYNSGTTTLTITVSKTHYTSIEKTINITMTKGSVAVPSITGATTTTSGGTVAVPSLTDATTFGWLGSAITPTKPTASGFTYGGTQSVTDVGNYTITATLTDSINYKWASGTENDVRNLTWKIVGNISVDFATDSYGTAATTVPNVKNSDENTFTFTPTLGTVASISLFNVSKVIYDEAAPTIATREADATPISSIGGVNIGCQIKVWKSENVVYVKVTGLLRNIALSAASRVA
ncbi:MAG: hypothetical protein LBM01_00530 [Christensenellaceae bacterium]|jgi:hypothetical protein|nr:hypothetical protein [Christensenellaceae bacterium]